MHRFAALRQEHPEFIFERYQVEETASTIRITYHFSIPDLADFAPQWEFTKGTDVPLHNNATFLNMVFSLGMVELISYWKTTCAPRVIVKAGWLDDYQIAWWKNQYFHGLGEFFYTNDIVVDGDTFMHIIPQGQKAAGDVCHGAMQQHACLIPIGGGKDSVVTLDVVSHMPYQRYGYIINGRGATMQSAVIGNIEPENLICATRTLDANMLNLNKQGYWNGHTPFSAIVAFSAVLAAYLHGIPYVVLSNESSANESTVADSTVNHQYSKSFQFEHDFHIYEKTYLQSGVYYFSLLRPLSEFQIARYFATLPQYHKVFRSCNVGSKQDAWCANCSKCLFVYLILSPFLAADRLVEIFGKDLLEDTGLIPIFDQLVGLHPEKPFECVGSREEVNTAITLAIQSLLDNGQPLPALFAHYVNSPLYQQYRNRENPFATYYDTENLLPPAFDAVLRERCLGNDR